MLLSIACEHDRAARTSDDAHTAYAAEPNRYRIVTGIGLVGGLQGTGDGDWAGLRDMLRACYPRRHFTADEMKSFAVVTMTGNVSMPVRLEGPVSVELFPMYTATKISGGKLIRSLLGEFSGSPFLVRAEGDVVPIYEDPEQSGGRLLQPGTVIGLPIELIDQSPGDPPDTANKPATQPGA
jgi:flagellar basal body P-ring protein FlgI